MIQIPGSKSYTNRALIMASLTKGHVTLKNPLFCDDTKAMIECLRTIGIQIEIGLNEMIVLNDISCVKEGDYELFAYDSGTTIRFMLSLLCIVPGVKIIGGSQRLNERPISDLVDALRSLGAEIEYIQKEGKLPVKVKSSSLVNNTRVLLKGDLSSQFCSSLLLISPYISPRFEIDLTGPLISKPYVDMTIGAMVDWGGELAEKKGSGGFLVEGGSYQKKEYVIEGDFSSASYFFATALLTKSKITLENLNPLSLQADRKFLQILETMGNRIVYGERSVTFYGENLIAIDVDMEECPDQVMTMAVISAFAKGITTISGVRSLRYKETERVVALKNELQKMGVYTEDTYDTLTIYGGFPKAAEIETYNDHRMAMAFAVAKSILKEMKINNPEVVHKTFPSFWDLFERFL